MAIIKIRNAAIDLDAAEIPNLPASKITTGTLDNARISLDAAEIPNLDTAKITTGTFATARLADSSVTTAKLNDSGVTTAKLNDASVSLAKLTATGTKDATTFLRGDNTFAEAGGGKVIQYKSDYDSASIGLSNTSWTDTNLSIAFTPTASGNRIVLKGMVQVYVDGAPSYYGNMAYRVLNGSGVIMEEYSVYTGYGGTEAVFNGMLPFNVYETTAGNTNARTYKVQVRNTDTNSGAHYNQYSGYSALEVWEIDYS